MSKEKVFLGYPEDFKGKFLIYPPKVREVVGNKYFAQFRQLFTFSQEELEDEYVKKNKNIDVSTIPTPFEFLLANAYHSKDFERTAKNAFYFFTKQHNLFYYSKPNYIKISLLINTQNLFYTSN